MISDRQRADLVEEFPELGDEEVTLPKEVFAHFGLLFFKFSLVEHSLIIIMTIFHLGEELAAKRVRTKTDWETAYDVGHDKARSKTFGNLIRAISVIEEFKPLLPRLAEIKKLRDYFAHHFFREEVGMYGNNEACWHTLWAIKSVRDRLVKIDRDLSAPTDALRQRIGVPSPQEEILVQTRRELDEETRARIATGIPFPWSETTE